MILGATTRLRWESLPPLWLVVLVVVPAVFFLVRFFYKRETGRVGRRMRVAMGLLRVAAILVVLLAIWGPYTETIETEPFKRHLILAIDTSKSMESRDDYANSPDLEEELRKAAKYAGSLSPSRRQRIQLVRDILGADRAYLEELAKTFRLHVYTFDGAAAGLFDPQDDEPADKAVTRLLGALPQLKAKGEVTRIGTAIRDLVRVFNAKNEPVAGILLFTDGRHTGGAPDPVEEAARARDAARDGIPIFPVAMGNPATAVNVSVSRIEAPEVVLAGDEVSFTVHVHARGLPDQPAELRASVLDDEGKEREPLPIDAPPFNLPDEGEKKRVTFRHVFNDPGTYDLKIGVPRVEGEAIEGDNYRTHVLRVVKLKMDVLLVSSMPSYTFRFLKEALLRAEKTITVNTLLLAAESGYPQDRSRDADDLLAFPERERLGKFDVIIFLDVDPSNPRIARDDDSKMRVIANLEDWVKQGGGLIVQAGRSDNFPGRYTSTPMMGLLPVVPYTALNDDVYNEIVELRTTKRFKLTEAGLHHPIMRILQDPELVKDFWDGDEYATEYEWYQPVVRTKSSATALAVRRATPGSSPDGVHRSDARGEPHPLIAIQSYGLGRVLWLGTDELWRMRKGVENLYYWRFWSGAIRHLATYRLLSGNKRIKIWVDRTDGRYRVGDSVGIEAKFLDTNFAPVAPPDGDFGTFKRSIKLRLPSGEEREVVLNAIPTTPPEGLFGGKVHAAREGTYRLIAEADNDEEPAEATFVVEDFSIEKLNPMLDMDTMRAIAAKSQAATPRVLTPGQFRHLISDDIVNRKGFKRTGEIRRDDLWDTSGFLWLFVAILAVEWILRRLNLLL